MREIKFRAWDKCNERMVEPRNILKICMSRLNQEPYLIVYLKKWMNPNREIREFDKCYTNEFELMQYTGLKDKNGTEIYEGDILKHHSLTEQMQKDLLHQIVGKIVIEKGMTYIVGKVSNGYIDEEIKTTNYKALLLSPELFEIIGNIHENPELLEV